MQEWWQRVSAKLDDWLWDLAIEWQGLPPKWLWRWLLNRKHYAS